MVSFKNYGLMDIRAISTFGVSVKQSSSAIGFFGTGLKYAIAVFLRHDQRVDINIGGDIYDFGTAKIEMRGQDFSIVTMKKNGGEVVELGFTTELGKQWDLWMAYRELYCNCMDEQGSVYVDDDEVEDDMTVVTIVGQECDRLFEDQANYFLPKIKASNNGFIEVRERPSSFFYYKGVRISELSKTAMHTYNALAHVELTEDRTVKNSWIPNYYICNHWLTCKNQAQIEKILLASNADFESSLDFNGCSIEPSVEFLNAVEKLSETKLTQINDSAIVVWKRTVKKNIAPTELVATPVIQKSLMKAIAFCRKHNYPVDEYPIKLIGSLGTSCLGLADNGTIFISERAFSLGGAKLVASTLIEEWVHLKYGFEDETRDMQNFLFDRLVSTLENIDGEPI